MRPKSRSRSNGGAARFRTHLSSGQFHANDSQRPASTSTTDPPCCNQARWHRHAVPLHQDHSHGTADLTAVETATPAGWTFGWMQAEWCETNWTYFRGQHNNDGSVFRQRGRTPARSSRACRDTITAGVPIYNDVGAGQSMILTSSTALPASLTAGHYDKPGELPAANNKHADRQTGISCARRSSNSCSARFWC